MLKRVLTHPNKILRSKANPVLKFDEELEGLITDLIDTANVMFGAGIAAPQIGESKRVVVIKPSAFQIENPFPSKYNEEYMVLINPVIETSGEKIEWIEACLSVPGVEGKVKRFENCIVKFLDEAGNMQTLEAGFPFSGGLQHEIDHLDGIVYLNRMDKKRRRSMHWKIQKVRQKEKIAARKRKRNLKNGANYV
jgi:peptide deformylase